MVLSHNLYVNFPVISWIFFCFLLVLSQYFRGNFLVCLEYSYITFQGIIWYFCLSLYFSSNFHVALFFLNCIPSCLINYFLILLCWFPSIFEIIALYFTSTFFVFSSYLSCTFPVLCQVNFLHFPNPFRDFFLVLSSNKNFCYFIYTF